MNSLNIKSSSTTRNFTPNPSLNINQDKDKQFRDNLNLVIEKIEGINDNRINIAKNIKLIEQNSKKFYDEAKVVFKNLKTLRNKKLNEEEDKQNHLIMEDRTSKTIRSNTPLTGETNKFFAQTASGFYDTNHGNLENKDKGINKEHRDLIKPHTGRNSDVAKNNFRSKSSKNIT